MARDPAFYDSAEDRRGGFCRAITQADDAITPNSDGGLHVDVPRPHIVHGAIAAHVEEPHLAFLDDRHGISVCGIATTYSKGDFFGALGAAYLLAGSGLLLLGFCWKRIRGDQKPRPEAGAFLLGRVEAEAENIAPDFLIWPLVGLPVEL